MLWLLVTAALAGDPCPIDFRLTDLGHFTWSEPRTADPVWDALVARLSKAECTTVRTTRAKDGRIPLGGQSYLDVATVQSLLVTDQRAYRCDDAHIATRPLAAVVRDGTWVSGDVLYQRGARRVMLTAIGWGTVCVPLAELEDPKTREAALTRLWDGATATLVSDRHANP